MNTIITHSFEDDVKKNLHKYVGEVGKSSIMLLSNDNNILTEKPQEVNNIEYYLCSVEFLDNAFDNANSYIEICNVKNNEYIKITNDTNGLSLSNNYTIKGVETLSDTLELITQNQFSSSNFENKNHKKGMFGIGLKVAMIIIPDVTIVLCDSSTRSRMIKSGKKNSTEYDNCFGAMKPNSFNVFIKSMPFLMNFFKYKSDIYCIDLAFLNRKLKINIDKNSVSCTRDSMKLVAEIKLNTKTLTKFECATNEKDIITVYAGESSNDSLLIVNGKEVKESGWVNKIRSVISKRLNCTNANIKSKISMCCHVNIRDAKFSSNNKNDIQNIKSVELHGNIDMKFFSEIIKPVMDKKIDTKIKKVELTGFSRARNTKDLTLYIVEGLSAESSFRNSIDRSNSAIFCTQGKVLNCIKNKSQAESNETVLQIARILGLNFHMDSYKGSYSKIVIACDPDPDGFHIVGLLLNLFNSLWSFILNRVELLAFPLYKNADNKSYSYVISNNVKKYYKGLGSFTIPEMKSLMISKDYLKSIDFNTDIKLLDEFFGIKSTFRFDLLKSQPQALELYLGNKTLTMQNIISMLHLFSEEVCDRSIPDISGFTRAERQAIYGSLNQSDKLLSVIGTIISKTAYQHAPDNMVGVVMKLGRTYVGSNNITILDIEGANGSRLKPKDYSSARYLRMNKSKTANKFPTSLHESSGYHNDEGKPTIPKLLSLYPFIFINGNYGIGCGIKTYMPCHNPEEVISYVTGKTNSIPSIWYRGFKGTIEIDDTKNTFITTGRYKIDSYLKNVMKFTITEIPIGIFVDKFIARIPTKLISKLVKIDTEEDANNSEEELTSDDIDIADFSTTDNIEIIVTVKKCGDGDVMKARIESMMKLKHHMSLRIYQDKQLYLFDDRTSMFEHYRTNILKYSQNYLDWLIARKRDDINLINMKIRIIEELIKVNINTIPDVNVYLEQRVKPYNRSIYDNMKAPHISNKYLELLRTDLNKQTSILEKYKSYDSVTFYDYHINNDCKN